MAYGYILAKVPNALAQCLYDWENEVVQTELSSMLTSAVNLPKMQLYIDSYHFSDMDQALKGLKTAPKTDTSIWIVLMYQPKSKTEITIVRYNVPPSDILYPCKPRFDVKVYVPPLPPISTFFTPADEAGNVSTDLNREETSPSPSV